MKKNPPNPEVVPAAPDVDTADLEVEAKQALEHAEAPVAPPAPVAATVEKAATPGDTAKFSPFYAALSALALLVSAGLVYFFFFATNTVEINLHSAPPGATIILDGRNLGVSPVKAKVKPGTHTVIFQQPGYKTFEEQIEVKFDGAVIEQTLTPLAPPSSN